MVRRAELAAPGRIPLGREEEVEKDGERQSRRKVSASLRNPRFLQLNTMKNPLPVYCARTATAAAEGLTAPACSRSRGAVPDVEGFPSRQSGQRRPPGGQEGL